MLFLNQGQCSDRRHKVQMVALQTSEGGRVAGTLSAGLELTALQFKKAAGQGVTSCPFPFTFVKSAQWSLEGQSLHLHHPWKESPPWLVWLYESSGAGASAQDREDWGRHRSLAHIHHCHSLPSSLSYNLRFHCSIYSIRPTQVFAYSK